MEFVTVQSLLVQGKEHVEIVETPIGSFQIRPLSLGEKAEIQSNSMAGVKSKTKADLSKVEKGTPPEESEIDIDFTALQKSTWESKFKVLAYGLSVGKQHYEPHQIKKLPIATDVMDTLYKKILAISEVTPKELVAFRQDEDGASVGDVNSVGNSVS